MPNILIVAQKPDDLADLQARLSQEGFACSVLSPVAWAVAEVASRSPDMLLVEIGAGGPRTDCVELLGRIKEDLGLPAIGLVPRRMLGSVDGHLESIDDFVVEPYDARELGLRARWLLRRTAHGGGRKLIKCGDLLMDLDRCEVTLAGTAIILTYMEYQLLKFLSANKGRVCTRELLLDKVWGYDYYGGDRTVDVHIRRLRSKIEDSTHTFIETVRNIGYRFRYDEPSRRTS